MRMPDSSIALLEKNGKVKERHNRIMKKIAGDEARSTEELDKQLSSVRKEMVDMKAFQVIYKKHSFPDPDNETVAIPNGKMIATDTKPSSLPPLDPHKLQLKHVSLQQQTDPFNLRKCMADSGIVEKIKNSKRNAKIRRQATTLRALKKTNTYKPISNRGDDNTSEASHHSVMPGNCTSYFSLKQFYEKEKDKLVNYWSPSEQRKRAINRIIHDVKISQSDSVNTEQPARRNLRTNPDLSVLPPISHSSS